MSRNLARYIGRTVEDPAAGVLDYNAWLYSGDQAGHTFGPPGEGDILVHGDGHTTAHGGTIGAPEEAREERLIRAAHLTPEEAAVFRLQASGEQQDAIAGKLGLTLRQVRTRVESAHGKLRAYAAALRAMEGE